MQIKTFDGKPFPTIHVVSDSIGETARTVAHAASVQFGVTNPNIRVLAKVKSFEEIEGYLESECARLADIGEEDGYGIEAKTCRLLVFYTLVNKEMRDLTSAYIDRTPGIYGIDLLTGAISALADMTGSQPLATPGALRIPNRDYFDRLEAINFTINHDDGCNPQDLVHADIVLVGVSRTCKTPLSIYLSQQGLKVANVPLDLETAAPKELKNVERTRLIGLMSSPEVLERVRNKRIRNTKQISEHYAQMEYIFEDLEKSREIMRQLGCYIVRTDGRGIEEAAQEIISYYQKYHDMPTGLQ